MTQPQTNKRYALQLYATAMEFYQVYPVLVADTSKLHDFTAVKHYNLCHAFELTLKGWLVYTGQFSEERLIYRYGHDLRKLANKVRAVYGPFKELDACMGFIHVLNPDYYGKSYEYPTRDNKLTGTNHAGFAATVEALIHILARDIRAERFPEKPLPVDPEKSFWKRIGDVVVRFGRWLKTLSN